MRTFWTKAHLTRKRGLKGNDSERKIWENWRKKDFDKLYINEKQSDWKMGDFWHWNLMHNFNDGAFPLSLKWGDQHYVMLGHTYLSPAYLPFFCFLSRSLPFEKKWIKHDEFKGFCNINSMAY